MLVSANNANSSHLLWPSKQVKKSSNFGKQCFFPETFMTACHISMLHFYHMRILKSFDKNGSDLLLCIHAQIKECHYEGDKCPEKVLSKQIDQKF